MTSIRRTIIQWISNAQGTTTCHLNDVRLTYDESLLATLSWDRAANQWYYFLKNSPDRIGPYSNLNLVRAAVETAVGGCQVQEVYR
jgi:hypothetical protein